MNVTIEFGAHPKPSPQNVVWTITNAVKTIEVPTEADNVAKKNHYLAYPIQLVEENTYSATLTIQNVQEDEATLEHLIRLRQENVDDPVYHRYGFCLVFFGELVDTFIILGLKSTLKEELRMRKSWKKVHLVELP